MSLAKRIFSAVSKPPIGVYRTWVGSHFPGRTSGRVAQAASAYLIGTGVLFSCGGNLGFAPLIALGAAMALYSGSVSYKDTHKPQ